MVRSLSRYRARILNGPVHVALSTFGLADEELVLGAHRDGQAKAYPVSLLHLSHIVNDTLGGSPFLAAFCPNCFSGVGYHRLVDGMELTFDLEGAYHGAFVMSDAQTKTLWAQLTGEALVGPLVGTRLEMVPMQMAKVGDWLRLHPDSLTPDVRVPAHLGQVMPGKMFSAVWEATIPRWDERLPPRTLVLGVAEGEQARAYVLDVANPGPRYLQDTLGEVPLALLATEGAWPLAYDRRIGDDVVEGRLVNGRLIDDTGSEWDDEGRALSGPRLGARLRTMTSQVVEWYAWSLYHPSTEVARPLDG
ncbi:MAG: DUF3179 domain-containing (seleno)protein [Acidimicrobiia bacterium]